MRIMHKKAFQLLVDNTSGVLSRISGLFSRRGYNIESITAGVTADPRYTRITIVASGDDDILDQIEKQVRKLVDVREINELPPEESVYRELALIKVRVDDVKRESVIAITNIFRGNIVDVALDSLIIEITGNQGKIDAFLKLLSGYEILELARTGITGLTRCSQGQGAWVQQSMEQWYGLRLDALHHTLTIKPQGLLTSFCLEGIRLGNYTFDICYEEKEGETHFHVKNRNDSNW